MHQTVIMAVAADLQHISEGRHPLDVRVGPETARACEHTATLARDMPHATVHATAGYSPVYRVYMNGVMHRHLCGLGIPKEQVFAPHAGAATFDTAGEMRMLVHMLFSGSEEDTYTIHLVCRWWHLPRAWFLLWLALGSKRRQRVGILPAGVHSTDQDMFMEPLRWVKGIFFGTFFRMRV